MTSTLALRLPESTNALAIVDEMRSAMEAIVDVEIVSEADERRIGELLRGIETLRRRAEDARKAEKAPHLAAGRDVDRAFSERLEPFDRVAALLRDRLSRKALEREAARRLAVETASAAAIAGDRARANEAIVLANDPVFAPVEVAGVATSFSWEVEACDVGAMPIAFLSPNHAAIAAEIKAAKAQAREPKIPGVTFRRVASLSVRGV